MWLCTYCTTRVKDGVAICPVCHHERPAPITSDAPAEPVTRAPRWLPPDLANKEVATDDPFFVRRSFLFTIVVSVACWLYYFVDEADTAGEIVRCIIFAMIVGLGTGLLVGVFVALSWAGVVTVLNGLFSPGPTPAFSGAGPEDKVEDAYHVLEDGRIEQVTRPAPDEGDSAGWQLQKRPEAENMKEGPAGD